MLCRSGRDVGSRPRPEGHLLPRFVLLGSEGRIGGLIASELERHGHAFRTAEPDVRALRSELGPEDVVINAAPPFAETAQLVLESVAEVGAAYTDTCLEQPVLRRIHLDWAHRLAAAGSTAVPGAGVAFLIGDCLAAVAADGRPDATDVHIAYVLPDRGGLRSHVSAGTRAALATVLPEGGVVLDRGAPQEQRVAQARRLAWFPKPVGPHHAAGVPGGEVLTVPRHLPTASTVATYLAMPSWRAELLQAAATLASRPSLQSWIQGMVARGSDPDPEDRATIRWACVAELAGPDGVGRAWAYGHDPQATSAVAVALVAEQLLAGDAPDGVIAPAELAPASSLLDQVAERSDLRWSAVRPAEVRPGAR